MINIPVLVITNIFELLLNIILRRDGKIMLIIIISWLYITIQVFKIINSCSIHVPIIYQNSIDQGHFRVRYLIKSYFLNRPRNEVMKTDLGLSFQHFFVKVFIIFLRPSHILTLAKPGERNFAIKWILHILTIDHFVIVGEHIKILGVSSHLKHFLESVIGQSRI